MDPTQLLLGHPHISAIERIGRPVGQGHARVELRPTVANEVFGARHHALGVVQRGALKAAYGSDTQFSHQSRLFGESLVRAAPAVVARHRDTGSEVPVHACGFDFEGRDS